MANSLEYNFRSKILSDLYYRGYLYQFTDVKAIDDLFESKKPITFYVGYDPTAQSLHVGHLLWIKLVNKLQQADHKAIVLVGGATGKIGDPTWKETQRKMLAYDTILDNINSINQKLKVLIDSNNVLFVNNDDWLSKLNYMEFLRDFGPLFSVNKMLAMDSVSTRLERQQHLSFLEFNYMLLQAYDFLYLHENYNCTLQIGGQDQWSNMISGVDLVRRRTGHETFGMSIPLLVNSDGKKMGKTESGTVWLNENMLLPLDFWQFWRNVDDKDVIKLMKLFTDLPINEIESFEKFIGQKEINEAKIILADAVTSFVHPKANLNDIHNAATGVKSSNEIAEINLSESMSLDKVLVQAGFAPSLSQARRLIDGNGVKVDDTVVNQCKFEIDHTCVITVGKKKFKRIVFCK